ncbi:50S ribosomal protein L19 [Candidatus Anaplasma sp. TIGMIC]|uniref:50S ribosomal protein L19 n=1 Tax=Candidatus Anaplasma sp. TIGMIC TaxID=3020713 RepID=UPI00232F354F|nr:50S ribosomal protein L19 [Candidatus Anaplasma sp. TIGMIC]MDB1135649.1 50S ribosomal protein L19 [Candidatus Anaplasma sp. TIGMIC]
MSELLTKFNLKQVAQLKQANNVELPVFNSGDTVKVSINVFDGVSWRMQTFEGVCIKKRNRGLHSSFTLRKISHNESIQLQVFTHSPNLKSVEVVRYGKVRRAKLYYLLDLFGKAARIKEKSDNRRKAAK